jgi:hypothetical protein
MFLDGMKISEVYSSTQSRIKTFKWISDKMALLEQRSTQSAKDKNLY